METGILSMDAAQYHAAAGTSRSDLEKIMPPKRTPAHFKEYRDAKARGETEKNTPAKTLGTVIHRAIFEPETMYGAYAIKPKGHNGATKEGKAWLEENKGRPLLGFDEYETVSAVSKAVCANADAMRLFSGGKPEQNVFAKDHDDFLRKARLDYFYEAGNVIPDLKTCESAFLEDLEWSIHKYGYYKQAAYYLDICNLLGMEKEKFVFVFVEKDPPYLVACYDLDSEAIKLGRSEYGCALQILKTCEAEDKWPGYPPGINRISLPQKKLDEAMKAGAL